MGTVWVFEAAHDWVFILNAIPMHGQCGHRLSRLLFAGDDKQLLSYKDVAQSAHARRKTFAWRITLLLTTDFPFLIFRRGKRGPRPRDGTLHKTPSLFCYSRTAPNEI